MLNPFDKPATLTTKPLPRTVENPLDELLPQERICDAFMNEMDAILTVFRACDNGGYQGPWPFTPWYFVICCESAAQRDAFSAAMHLNGHGVQYWTGKAFIGTLEWLKTAQNCPRFEKRHNPFARDTSAPKNAPESKYSHLRNEARKVKEKMRRYTESSWLAISFPSQKECDTALQVLGFPPAIKNVHIDDLLPAIERVYGVKLDVPAVEFGLRATHRPDAALNVLVMPD